MHTIGREREKEHARSYLKNPADAVLIETVIDVVHDHLEGRFDVACARKAFLSAFENGGSGAWEQAGSWLRKISLDRADLHSVWLELASSTKLKLRRIAASFATDLPPEQARRLIQSLSRDPSKAVRLKVASDLTVTPVEGTGQILDFWLQEEEDSAVRAELERARTA